MKNIFLRLYLALFLSLAGIAIGLDYFYAQMQNDEQQDADTIALWRASSQALLSAGRATRGHIAPGSASYTIKLDELQWPATLLAQLQKDGALILTDHQGQRYFYGLLMAQPQRVMVWPLPNPVEREHALWLLAFYGTLALVIFIWLRPLVRDIDQLQQAVRASHLPSAEFSPPLQQLRQRSALTPVAAAFAQLQSRTAELMALQRDIANAVSHDIRTPLARIRFALAMLPASTDEKMLSSIRSDISDIEKLCNETLRYAQFEHQVPVLQRSDIALMSAVNAVVDRYQHQTSIRFEVLIEQAVLLNFDPDCLHRVLQNLLDNALRYARAQIRISWRSNEHEQRLSVEDDGPGLTATRSVTGGAKISAGAAPDHHAAAPENTMIQYGLGLAIVKKIGLWHGAQLQLEQSAELGGAKISLVWPLA